MREEHSQIESEVRVPQRARLTEQSAGFSNPLLVVLFMAIGGKNSFVRRPCGAMRKKRGGGVENTRGGGAAGVSVSCAKAALRTPLRGPARLHGCRSVGCAKAACNAVELKDAGCICRPATGVDPAVLLGVRGGNGTGVGVVVAGNALSALLPPLAFAGGVIPEASTMRAQRRRAERAVRARKQRTGERSAGTSTIDAGGAHCCRVLCASHALSLAWESHAWPQRRQVCCSCPFPACWQLWAAQASRCHQQKVHLPHH
eukprot:602094-Pleurochrysis_carterae.AAC.2